MYLRNVRNTAQIWCKDPRAEFKTRVNHRESLKFVKIKMSLGSKTLKEAFLEIVNNNN
jgi:hypothetical protein